MPGDSASDPGPSATALPGRRFGFLELLIAVGLVALVLSLALPPLERARQGAGRLPCPSNLRQIGQALTLYTHDHRGSHFPDSLEPLVGEYLVPKGLVCPSSGDTPARGGTPDEVREAIRAGGHVSYVYVGGGLTFESGPEYVVAYDRPGNHGDDGCNLLFADGRVEWIPMLQMKHVLDEVAAGRLPVRWPIAAPATRRAAPVR